MLQRNVIRPMKAHRRQLTSAPAAAGEIFYVGALVAYDHEGFLRPAADDLSLALPAGVVVESKFPDDPSAHHAHLDNRNGSNGSIVGDRYERAVTFDTIGHYFFPNVTGSPIPGGIAWIVDDDTVSATPNQSGLAAGIFLHPGVDQFRQAGWYVDISRMSRQQLSGAASINGSLGFRTTVSGNEDLGGGVLGLKGFRSVRFDATPFGSSAAVGRTGFGSGGEMPDNIAGILQAETASDGWGYVASFGKAKAEVGDVGIAAFDTFFFLDNGTIKSASELVAPYAKPTLGWYGHTLAAGNPGDIIDVFLYGWFPAHTESP